jgi:hypothetical protein
VGCGFVGDVGFSDFEQLKNIKDMMNKKEKQNKMSFLIIVYSFLIASMNNVFFILYLLKQKKANKNFKFK